MMSGRLLVLSVVVALCAVVADGFQKGEDDQKQKRQTTQCDKDIGKILCDDFQKEMVDCAAFMPPEEPPFFYKCSKTVLSVETDSMEHVLEAVCSQGEQVEKAWEMIDCWNEEMEQAVKNMTNDKVYPLKHFQCKKRIFKDAVKKAGCPCMIEKGFMCDLPSRKFG